MLRLLGALLAKRVEHKNGSTSGTGGYVEVPLGNLKKRLGFRVTRCLPYSLLRKSTSGVH